jgi:cAMP-binding proteins - catabolite gene activator and regulatory subunit of cAMP-dependent protein kinases
MNVESAKDSFLEAFGHLFPTKEWPQARLSELLSGLRFREMEAGAVLLREGQVCSSLPFVIEGSIRVFKRAESGREITLYRIERGQCCVLSVGCGSSLDSFPAAVVVEEPTFAAFMGIEEVRRLLAVDGTFRDFILAQFSSRMVEVMELIEEVAFRRVDERLAQWLLESSTSPRGPDGHVELSATHQELADHVGTSREVVSRILKDWEQRSLLRLSRGSIELLPGFEALRPDRPRA